MTPAGQGALRIDATARGGSTSLGGQGTNTSVVIDCATPPRRPSCRPTGSAAAPRSHTAPRGRRAIHLAEALRAPVSSTDSTNALEE